ncbi:MAG: cation-translocating P-type ATPase [Spirochaetaceae bacterium]|nr:MAG: cation-translocating P-type ATPase [Spirochaetaceae bacterium]
MDDGTAWHTLDPDAAMRRLDTDGKRGLADRIAGQRLIERGANELVDQGSKSPLRILAEQFTSLMVLLLIAAAAVSGLLLREWEDALVILVIVILNALLGFWQEFRAEKALAALKSLAAPRIRVLRDARVLEIPARELVPGDILLVEAGNLVPADCRIIEAANLKVQEAALTGEAEAVDKDSAVLGEEDLALGDRRNMLYMGTVVTYGRGKAVVTATGMASELGKIATLIQETVPEKTVLQKKLAALSIVLVFCALGLIALVAVEGWLLQGQSLKELFITAVSMAVAAIPEGLPAVVTIALALGAQRMLRRRALIRKLPAVETLGSVTVICSDKTGTLTQNRMSVTILDLLDEQVEFSTDSRSAGAESDLNPAAKLLLTSAALCSDAVLKEYSTTFETLGDPTEGALVTAAARAGLSKPDLEGALPRIGELPFDSERKRMTTVHSLADWASAGESSAVSAEDGPRSTIPKQLVAQLLEIFSALSRAGGIDPENAAVAVLTKGAVDSLLEVCSSVWRNGIAESLTETWERRIQGANESMAARGVRVLGVAVKSADKGQTQDQWERDLVFVGMIGMLDPLRTEVKQAVETCRRAGIRPVMITGDHPLIARNIATQLGLHNTERVLTGRDLGGMERTELAEEVERTSVYARVAPEHKLKIVDAFQERGHIVAMTGDGINDAPALKSADIGVAMGITGTDVTKEAAAMVLQDDNFATIVAAVEEGRIIFDNILRFVRYILASNWAEILVMLLAPLFGLPIPLFPVQILWMNLVTDGLPALALGVEPGEKDVMGRPPREPARPILSRNTGVHILWVGLLMAALALWVGGSQYGVFASRILNTTAAAGTWRTVLFTTLVFSQLTLALAERSRRSSLLQIGLLSNRYMLIAVALTFCLQLAVIYLPVVQDFFATVPLSAIQIGVCVGLSLIVLMAVEAEKLVLRIIRKSARS